MRGYLVESCSCEDSQSKAYSCWIGRKATAKREKKRERPQTRALADRHICTDLDRRLRWQRPGAIQPRGKKAGRKRGEILGRKPIAQGIGNDTERQRRIEQEVKKAACGVPWCN